MQVSRQSQGLVVQTDRYTLSFPTDRPFVRLESPQGELLLELFTFSSVHPMSGRDDTYTSGQWVTHETADGVDITITASSTCCTPSPLTSRVIDGLSLLRAILSISSM